MFYNVRDINDFKQIACPHFVLASTGRQSSNQKGEALPLRDKDSV